MVGDLGVSKMVTAESSPTQGGLGMHWEKQVIENWNGAGQRSR